MIALDRSAWRLAINVPELWTYFFRVSSLAYPNLLGKKDYVVVVVVVDNRLLCVDFKLKVMVMFTSKLYLGIKIDRIQSMEDIFGIWNWKWQRNKTMWQIVKSNGHIFSWSFSMKLFENFNGKQRLALSILKWQTTELACNHFLIK